MERTKTTMAESAVKRRKLDHSSAENAGGDEASFASFGDSEAEGAEVASAGDSTRDGALDMNLEDGNFDGVEDDEEDEGDDIEEEERVDEPQTGVQSGKLDSGQKHNARPDRTARPDRSKVAADAAGAAYSAGTFKSNMFKLQVDQLLDQSRPKRGKREVGVEAALRLLKKTIEQAPVRESLAVDEAERRLLTASKVAIPFPDPRPPKDAKYRLEYAKPSNVNVAGSYALDTRSRTIDVLNVDMTVTMPKALFQEKDYLNHRYFYKRAYYLACLAAAIKDAHSSSYELRFRSLHDDPLTPILTVAPLSRPTDGDETKPAPKWYVNIIPCTQADTFAHDKLLPSKNCVRSTADEQTVPTPFYNSTLRANMLVTSYLKLLHESIKSCPAFRDACLLGSTWLRQRGFGSSIADGGIGNFEWSALMACMLQGGGPNGKSLINEGYSSYQLFKGTLQMLAMKDLSKQGLTIGHAANGIKPNGDGTPSVWDAARAHNLLFKMSPWSYNTLRHESRTALIMLSDQLFDGFEFTFILRTDNPRLRYDYSAELPVSSVQVSKQESHQAFSNSHKLYDVLRRGLGDRVSQIGIATPTSEAWQLGSVSPKTASSKSLTIGLIVNADTVGRTVDHGPPPESKSEAASFRQFWGEKAELRRFKDGSILESLIWSSASGGESVLEQIVRYLLKKHFGEKAEEDAVLVGDGVWKMLGPSNGLAPFQPFVEGYKQLENDIRGLDGLPLSIRQIMPADEQLRYSAINTPSAPHHKRRPMPASVTIQFEGSARWPDDLVAIQRTKVAFLLKLSELMQEAVAAVTTRIGLENEANDIVNQAYLDIVYDSGIAFRLRIHHDREQTLLERRLKDKSLGPQAKETAALGLATYKRDYIRAPAHTQAIARLCMRYPALSGTMRLLKKWFASHLLTNHIADEILELMAVRTFVQPWPWQTPSSIQTGFLRTLRWLSRWDWRAEPLIVDLSGSGELKQADVQAITTRFEAWRKLDPSLNRTVLFAASSVDPDGTTWTDGRPAKVVAGRMTALAKAACSEMEEKQSRLEPAALFVSPLDDYHFVITLNSAVAGGRKKRVSNNGAAFKNLELDLLDDDSAVGFNPAHDYLTEVENIYGSAVVLFSGMPERPVIAGLWSPQTAPRAWKVNLAYSTRPKKAAKEEEEVQAEINKEAMLAEIARLGGDLVESVRVNG